MSAKHSVSGEKAQKGLSPFKALRCQAVRFAPYPNRMQRIWALNALNHVHGEGTMVRVLPVHGPNTTDAMPETLLSTGLGSWQ